MSKARGFEFINSIGGGARRVHYASSRVVIEEAMSNGVIAGYPW